ncbi:AAA family ATPase [Nonomuraea sp. NN258]|uniref:BTAD domain-containing putative transcriptional regulator n=1 Tax=Nonomuraea antri TaxID=2730852 RepID=UPI001567D9D6|nr:BTAD domain-containing putative transcriptional regulator [Nonomuraea antri]NRQ30289.1 AAA family ATPase [Nonomuraea antri]
MVEFRVLGPLEVRGDDGGPVRGLGGPRPRAVLARLLVARGAVVSTDTLIHDLYGDAAPPSALPTLHSYVSNLRRAVEPDRSPRTPAKLLVARAPGYLLATADVDAGRFAELINRAEFRASREALECLEEALALWRGTPYGEFADERWALTEVGRLCELRLVAVERRARALLDLGRPQSAITDLEAETAANPLRERLWCLLALALYRTGRQAEALNVLRRAAELLAGQLGLDPGPELRALQEDILRQVESLEPANDQPSALVSEPAAARLAGAGLALRGRDQQLAELTALPGKATRAGLAVAAVSGEPGIGKTRLLEAFDAHCAGQGRLVLWGRCHDAEGTPPLWPWMQVFESLERHCPPADRRALAGLLDGERSDGAHDALLLRRNQAIARWLATASRVRPLVIVLDDLQWADPASLDLLRDLLVLNGTREGDLTLVTAYRSGTDDPLNRLFRYDLLRLRLTGLNPDAARELAADLGVELDEESALRMTGYTGGNPFFLRESVKLLAVDERADAVPEAVTELVRMRLDALPGLRPALVVAALLGREFDPAIVARAAGEDTYDALDLAVRAGLLVTAGDRAERAGLSTSGRLAFAHDLVRETLVLDVPPLRKAAVHRDLARALAERPGADVAVIAHHAVQAGPAAYGEAVRWAVAAADQADLRLAYREAATWLGQAIAAHDASGGDPAEHVELLLRQVRSLLRAGDPIAAREARAAAIRAADRVGVTSRDTGRELLIRALTALDIPAVWTLRDPYEAVELRLVHRLETALADLPGADAPERAMLLAGLAQELYDGTGDPRCDTLSARAVAMARRLGEPRLLMRTLNARHQALPQPRHVPELLQITDELHELAATAGSPGFELLARMMDTHNRLEMFDLQGADQAATRCETLLERLPLPWPRFQHTLWRANRYALDGRFDAAERMYAEAEAQTEHVGVWHARPTVAMGRLGLNFHRGTMAGTGPLIEAIRGVHPTLDHDADTLRLSALGRLEEARRLNGGPRAAPPLDWSWLSMTCLRAAAVAALGRVHECRAAYATLSPYSGRISALSAVICLGPVDWFLALLASALGRHRSAIEHLTALERLADRNGLTWWRDRAAAAAREIPVRAQLRLATSR